MSFFAALFGKRVVAASGGLQSEEWRVELWLSQLRCSLNKDFLLRGFASLVKGMGTANGVGGILLEPMNVWNSFSRAKESFSQLRRQLSLTREPRPCFGYSLIPNSAFSPLSTLNSLQQSSSDFSEELCCCAVIGFYLIF